MDSAVLAEAAPSLRADIEVKKINLALQGGGAHGAFAWGVLDRLLDDDRIEIEGISATSAGAMNATVLTYGYAAGGRQGARKALDGFWRRVAHIAAMSPFQATWLDRLMGNKSLENSPAFLWLEMMTRMVSPYQLNPINYNPLREALERSVDFKMMRSEPLPIRLYLSATNVRSSKVKIFCGNDVTPDAVMASGCLPFLFQAVEIDGEHYWDGGYLGNPAIHPLIHECASSDVVIVQINPLVRDEVPTSARDILNRINEMTFNASLVREMAGIATITSLVESGALNDDRYTAVRFHQISAEEELAKYGALSKMNTERSFLEHLHRLGYETADKWIAENHERIGWESTLDVLDRFL